jgi:hypothetical protein
MSWRYRAGFRAGAACRWYQVSRMARRQLRRAILAPGRLHAGLHGRTWPDRETGQRV